MSEEEYLNEEREKCIDLKVRVNYLKKIKGLEVYFYTRQRRNEEQLWPTEKFRLEIWADDTWDDVKTRIETFEKCEIVSWPQIKDIVDQTKG